MIDDLIGGAVGAVFEGVAGVVGDVIAEVVAYTVTDAVVDVAGAALEGLVDAASGSVDGDPRTQEPQAVRQLPDA